MTRTWGRERGVMRPAEQGNAKGVIDFPLLLIGGLIVLGVATVPMTDVQQAWFAVLTSVLFMVVNRFSGRWVSVFLIMLSLGVSTRYIFWRATQTLSWNSALEGVLGVLLVMAELYAIVVLVLGYIQTVWPLERKVLPLPEDAALWPTVDIFVPTYNESMSIVRATVLAAMAIDWPADKCKVFILDDGKREEFRRFAEDVGCGYITRTDNRHAKAGNINNALKQTNGEFVLIFDCDHIATRAFLQLTMGWLVAEPNLAMVQTPHHFYSPDPFQRNLAAGTRVPAEGNMFYGLVQDGNDYWNATFFCGSCAVIRRTALEEIGGIAVETVTEDAHTMLKLHRRGWDSAYLRLPLAAGLATERLILHIGQRMRWARGMIQIFRLDCPLFGPGLTWAQRLCYTQAMGHFFFAIPRLIFLCSPLCYLLGNQNVIAASPLAICAYALPHLIHAVGTNARLQKNNRHSFWSELYETVLALFLVRLTIATIISPRHGKFNVTAKGGLLENGYFDLGAVYPNLILVVLLVIGIMRGVINAVFFTVPVLTLQALILNSVWATLSLITVMGALAVGRETRQLRNRARVRAEVPVSISLPGGQVVHGVTRDLSQGGAFIIAEQPAEPVSGDWDVDFHLTDETVSIPSRILRWDTKTLQISFQPVSLADESAIIRTVFGRADAWADWDDYDDDQPLRSLGRVLVSIKGLFRPRDRSASDGLRRAAGRPRNSGPGSSRKGTGNGKNGKARAAAITGVVLALSLLHGAAAQTVTAGGAQSGGFVITPAPDTSATQAAMPQPAATPASAPVSLAPATVPSPLRRRHVTRTAAAAPARTLATRTLAAQTAAIRTTAIQTAAVPVTDNVPLPPVNAAPAAAPTVPGTEAPAAAATAATSVPPATPEAASDAAVPAAAAAPATDGYTTSTRTVTFTLKQLGAAGSLQLRGVTTLSGVQFGIRTDEVVTNAELNINGVLSPYMLPEWSNVTVTLNEQYIGTIPLNRDHPSFTNLKMPISPVFFQDDNRLNFKFTGHYTRDCEDPLSGLLWATIYDNSTITLTLARLPPQRDLARLPLPFFDRHEKSLFLQPFVLDSNPSDTELRAAGVVASWFGRLADFRGAKFPVSNDIPAEGNAVVFLQSADRARQLGLAEIDGPTLAEVANPNDANGTLLLVAGRSDQEMLDAALALSVGSRTLGGATAVVSAPALAQRTPYDAPAWIPTNRPVKFGELVDASALQGTGYSPGTMTVPFRTSPDLFSWRKQGFPVKIYYRSPPGPIIDLSVSRLDVAINQLYLASFPLARDPTGADNWFTRLFGIGLQQAHASVDVPYYDLFGSNSLSFNFDATPLKRGRCIQVPSDLRMSIDPTSTLDLSGAYRISKLPNLAYFVNSGFPFTRMADLSDTAVIMEDAPTTAEITAYLDLMGRIGMITGLPVLRVTVVRPSEVNNVAGKDLLLIGTMSRLGDASDLLAGGPYQVKDGALTVSDGGLLDGVYRVFGDQGARDRARLVNQLSVPLPDDAIAMIGLQSPLNKGRSLVALLASTPQGLDEIVSDMSDPNLTSNIQGDLTLLSGGQATSYRIGPTFTYGQIPLWVWPAWYLQGEPGVTLLLLVGGCVLLMIPFFWLLHRRASRRLRGGPGSH